VSRSRFAVLGLCVAFAACGEKFVANTGSGATAGSSSAGRVDAQAGGETEAGGSAGHDDADAGDAGSDSGDPGGRAGAHANGGVGGLPGIAGGGSSSGGTSGSSGSGTGGSLSDPTLPQPGLLVWLRADFGIQQKEGHVQTWLDQSGNQLDATATGTARPTYLADGFDGRPTIEFDGGQEQFLRFADGFGDFSKGVTGFIVAKPTTADCESMLEFSNGSEIDDIALGMFEDKWAYEVATSYFQSTTTIDHQRFSLYTAVHRSTVASELRINGSAKGTLAMPLPALPSSGVRLYNFVGHTLYEGGCKYFTGQISEIILYSRTLTLVEVNGIEKYLDTRWALSEQDSPAP